MRILSGRPSRQVAAAADDLLRAIAVKERKHSEALRHARRAARQARAALRRRCLTPWLDMGGRASVGRVEKDLAFYLRNLGQCTSCSCHRTRSPTVACGTWAERQRTFRAASGLSRPPRRRTTGSASSWRRSRGSGSRELTLDQLVPTDSQAWAILAVALADDQQVTAAHAAIGNALANPWRLASEEPETLAYAVRACEHLGEHERAGHDEAAPAALAELERASQRDEFPALRERLSEDWTDREWEKAQLLLCLQRDPGAELEERRRFLEEALELSNTPAPRARSERAGCAAITHWFSLAAASAGARRQVQLALALDPVSPFERFVLGQVYMNLSHLTDARTAFEEALLHDPEQPTYREYLADVLKALASLAPDAAQREELLTGVRTG